LIWNSLTWQGYSPKRIEVPAKREMRGMIIKNGLVWNGRSFEKRTLYVENGKFIEYTDQGPVVDATGLFVMPGFVDSHAHVIGTGLKLLTYDLEKVELQNVLSEKDSGDFIIARGWENLPKNELLSIANSFEKPVFLIRKCGHVAWVNDYLKKSLNLPDNLIYEGQIEHVWGEFGSDLYEKAFDEGQMEFLRHGVTQVHSDDLHGIDFGGLKELLKRSKIRIFEKLNTCEPWLYEFGDVGLSKIGSIKLFADGSLGAQTAYMYDSYQGSNETGMYTLPDNFDDIVKFAESKGIQLSIHVIGDKALHEVLERFDKNEVHSRHRLIHLQFIRKNDFDRLRNYHLAVQPHFYFEDIPLLDTISYEMGYPFLEMYKRGYSVAFSTDSPVSPADPKYVIENAMNMGFTKHQSLNLYSESGSKMAGIKSGKIAEGYLADFCLYTGSVVENDPIKVYINGEEVTYLV